MCTSVTAPSCAGAHPGDQPFERGFAGSTIASTRRSSPGYSAGCVASSFPPEGLAQELRQEYPITAGKLSVIPNAVDRQRMDQPAGFDRHAWRSSLGLRDGDIAVVFTALGHFERKGLPVLLQALRQVDDRFKLLVIGGQPGLVKAYRSDAARMNLDGKVTFVGMRDDVRPYLWSGDVFALPSTYEAFPLAALEAAAAGLPLLATELHGLTDLLVDGGNGFILEPTQASVAAGLQRFGRLGQGGATGHGPVGPGRRPAVRGRRLRGQLEEAVRGPRGGARPLRRGPAWTPRTGA